MSEVLHTSNKFRPQTILQARELKLVYSHLNEVWSVKSMRSACKTAPSSQTERVQRLAEQ
jgi:hypothetical protein